MDAIDLQRIIKEGENSLVQFKLKLTKQSADDISAEFVALSNAEGGTLIIGVEDKTGEIIGLSFGELEEYNNLLFNWSTNNVKPAISIFTETLTINDRQVLVAKIPKGFDKPYCDKNMVYWMKSAANKRRVSPEELKRLFQASGKLYAERTPLYQSSFSDLDFKLLTGFYEKKYNEPMPETQAEVEFLLTNIQLLEGSNLTLAGALLFGKNNHNIIPECCITAIWFVGNDLAGTQYRGSENIYGNIKDQYERGFAFISKAINYIQNGRSFNSLGEPEIPLLVFEELLVNAIIHRDYFINDSIKIFIFDNRIEIRSPGKLPNSITESQIKKGIRRTRNVILTSFAFDILPFRGIGSGIVRSLHAYPDIEFKNDAEGEQFTVTIKRPENK